MIAKKKIHQFSENNLCVCLFCDSPTGYLCVNNCWEVLWNCVYAGAGLMCGEDIYFRAGLLQREIMRWKCSPSGDNLLTYCTKPTTHSKCRMCFVRVTFNAGSSFILFYVFIYLFCITTRYIFSSADLPVWLEWFQIIQWPISTKYKINEGLRIFSR